MKKKIGFILTIILFTILTIFLSINSNNKKITKDERIVLSDSSTPIKLSKNGSSNYTSSVKDYYIEDSNDLKVFFSLSDMQKGYTFTVTRDIDMTGVSISKKGYFGGILDGNGHEISNLEFPFDTTDQHSFIGMLTGGTIKNITFSDIETPERIQSFSHNTGYVYFIETVENGELYNIHFKNIQFGGTVSRTGSNGELSDVNCYGYSSVALVNKLRQSINHCYIEPGDNYNDCSCFLGIDNVAGFAINTYNGNSCEVARCEIKDTVIMGLGNIGAVMATASSALVTSNMVYSTIVTTLDEDSFSDSIAKQRVSEKLASSEYNVNIGGIVGVASSTGCGIETHVIGNAFTDRLSSSLISNDGSGGIIEQRGVLSATAGNVKIGGIIGSIDSSAMPKVNLNMFHSSISCDYNDTCKLDENYTTNFYTCPEIMDDMVSVDNYFLLKTDDSPEDYTTTIYIHHSETDVYDKAVNVCGSVKRLSDGQVAADQGLELYDAYPTEYIFPCSKNTTNPSIYDEVTTGDFKYYKMYADFDDENHGGMYFWFEEYSNMAITFDLSDMDELNVETFLAKGDDALRGYFCQDDKSDMAQLTSLCPHRYTIDSENNKYAFDFENGNSYYPFYGTTCRIAYYDPAAANSKRANEIDKFAVDNEYYILGENITYSNADIVMGKEIKFIEVIYDCDDLGVDFQPYQTGISRLLYNNQTQGILSRMWPVTVLQDYMGNDLKAYLVDYTPDGTDPDYQLESMFTGPTVSYSSSDTSTTMVSGAEGFQGLWDHMQEEGFMIKYHFASAQSSINFGNVHFISKELHDGYTYSSINVSIRFYDENNQELVNTHRIKAEITDIGGGTYTYRIDYNIQFVDEVGWYNLFFKFCVVMDAYQYTFDIGSYKTLCDITDGNLYGENIHTVFAACNYESEDLTLGKDFEYLTYHYHDDTEPTFFYNQVNYNYEGSECTLSETRYEYGIPFNPLRDTDKTPGTNESYCWTISGFNHNEVAYDKENETFYFYVGNEENSIIRGNDFNPTIIIKKDTEIYRIYQTFNSDEVALNIYGKDPIYGVDDDLINKYIYTTEYINLNCYYKHKYDEGNGTYEEYRLPNIKVGIVDDFYSASDEAEIKGLIISAEAYYYNDSNIKVPLSLNSNFIDTSLEKDIYIEYTVALPKEYANAKNKFDTRDVKIDIEYLDNDDASHTIEDYRGINFNFSTSSKENKKDGSTIITYENSKIYWQLGITNEYLWITDESYGLNSFVQLSNQAINKTYHEYDFEYTDSTNNLYKFEAEFIDLSNSSRRFMLAHKIFVENRDRISFDFTHNNDGKKTTITIDGEDYKNSYTTGYVTSTGHVIIQTVFENYSVNYSWKSNTLSDTSLGSLFINSSYVSEINDPFTFEDSSINYRMSVGDIIKLKTSTNNEMDALVYKMSYQYSDGSELIDFDTIPEVPVMNNIYVTIYLALEEEYGEAYTYNSIDIDNVNLDFEPYEGNISFAYSDSLTNFDRSHNGGCNFDGNTLIYYSGDAKSFWLILDNSIKVLLDMPEVSIDSYIEIYSITFKLGDGGQHVPYYANVNGYSLSYGANTEEHTVYVLGGKDIIFDFTYELDDGYEIKSVDDELDIENNSYKLQGVKNTDSLVFNLELEAKWYRVYYFLTREDYDNCAYELDGSEVPGVTSELVQYGERLPKYPLTRSDYRLASSYIVDGYGSIKVMKDTTMDMKNLAIYGDWADAGKLQFEFYFYDENFENKDYGEYNLDDVRLCLLKDGNEELMERIPSSQADIAENEYKLEVENVNDGVYFYRYNFIYNSLVEPENIKIYIKFPETNEYKFFSTMDLDVNEFNWHKFTATIVNADEFDLDSHLTINNLGWYESSDVTIQLEFDLDEDYTVSFTNQELARVLNIYNSSIVRITNISAVMDYNHNSTDIGFTVTRKTYNIYYYMDGNLVKTESYHSGEDVSMWVPTQDVVMGLRYTAWNEEITVMPKKNVTVFANTIAGTTKTFTINFSGTITEGMFFIADNKKEITSKTEIIEVIVSGNTITATYKDGKAFLWMLDPITNESRYLDVDLDNIEEINLVKYTIPESISNVEVSNLGYHLKNESVNFEVVTDEGYGFTTTEMLVGNTIILSETSDHEINITPYLESYNIYYFINDVLLHTDTYKYMDLITLWAYDYSYNGVFNFKNWSLPDSIKTMPASDLLVYGQELASYNVISLPTISNIHAGEMLATAEFSGGMITVEGKLLEGKYYFKDSETIVKKEDSLTTEFLCVFQPNNMYLAPYEFYVTVLVCNPKYKGALDDIYVVSRTDTSISLHINPKYEFYVDKGNYQLGRDLVLTGLKENTVYTITYRYKEDDTYCASNPLTYRIKTLSKDELLYQNSQRYGLELIETLVNFIDNKTIQRYLSLFQTKLSLEYEEEMNGIEAEAYVAYLKDVFDLFIDIESVRVPLSKLDPTRINNYANKVLEEIASLAFNNAESATYLANYSNYACNALKKADDILGYFNISFNELLKNNQSDEVIYLQALTSTEKIEALEKNEYVITRVDELFNYNYSNYSHVDLDEYKESYIGNTVNLMTTLNSSIHSTDSDIVTNSINLCVSRVQAKTYEDYTFNREEYDRLFFIAAEAAVVAHMQMVVLNNLDESYSFKVSVIKDISKAILLKRVYLALVDKYKDFDTFYNEYKEMIEEGNDMTYQDCVSQFGKKLDNLLVVPVNSDLTSTEVVVLYLFIASISTVLIIFIVRYFIKRRMNYATRQREQ